MRSGGRRVQWVELLGALGIAHYMPACHFKKFRLLLKHILVEVTQATCPLQRKTGVSTFSQEHPLTPMQAANHCQAYFIIAEVPSMKEIHTPALKNTRWRGCEVRDCVRWIMKCSLSCLRTPCLWDRSARVSFSTRML